MQKPFQLHHSYKLQKPDIYCATRMGNKKIINWCSKKNILAGYYLCPVLLLLQPKYAPWGQNTKCCFELDGKAVWLQTASIYDRFAALQNYEK